MTSTETHAITNVRTELIATQILLTVRRLSPEDIRMKMQETVEVAFHLGCFRAVTFYAVRSGASGEDQCYAMLRVSLNHDLHLTELRVHPRVSVDPDWGEELLSPELDILIEPFRNVICRFKLRVLVHLKLNRETSASIGGHLKRASPPPWVGTSLRLPPIALEKLEELTVDYVLAKDLEKLEQSAT